jgi:hypothetical protein
MFVVLVNKQGPTLFYVEINQTLFQFFVDKAVESFDTYFKE